MKPRKVFLLFEVETDIAIKDLRKKGEYGIYSGYYKGMLNIIQVQANVAKKEKEPTMGKKKKYSTSLLPNRGPDFHPNWGTDIHPCK